MTLKEGIASFRMRVLRHGTNMAMVAAGGRIPRVANFSKSVNLDNLS